MKLPRQVAFRALKASCSLVIRLLCPPLQEETVAELRTVESEAASYLDQISRYERAELFRKSSWEKQPAWGRCPNFSRAGWAGKKNLGALCLTFSISVFLPDIISQEQSWFPK